MGNKFELLCHQSSISQKNSFINGVPTCLQAILQCYFQTPQLLYTQYKQTCKEDLMFSFVLNKQQFKRFFEKYFTKKQEQINQNDIENEREEEYWKEIRKQIFELLSIHNQQHDIKVINMLEFYTALVIVAQFGEPDMDDDISSNYHGIGGSVSFTLGEGNTISHIEQANFGSEEEIKSAHNLKRNSELIEHKINLMILIYTFRDQHSLNISEVIIMARTCMNVMSKIYPKADLFKNQQTLEEIKTLMLSLFQQRIEDQIRAQKTQSRQNLTERPKQPQIVEPMMNERVANVSLMKKYTASEKAPNSAFPSPFSSKSTSSQSGFRKQDDHFQHETLEEKKDRLFKWNNYQNIKLSQELIKETLIENLNILRFINLFEAFDRAVLSWGSNEQFQIGLILKKDLEKFYLRHANSNEMLKIRQDQILQQIIDIKSKYQQQSNQSNVQETPEQQQPKKQSSSMYTSFERKLMFEKPSLLMAMLNTSIEDIYSNKSFTLYLSSLGQVFSMGQDFRKVKHDFLYGIPRQLRIENKVKQVALGKDHGLFLDEIGQIYSFGSNQFGQLGIQDKSQLDYQLSPLTHQKLYYALNPILVPYFAINSDEIGPIKQLGCGDNFSVVLTVNGQVYSFGIASQGQLGISLQKGMIKQVIEHEGVKYSRSIQQIEEFETVSIDRIIISKQHLYSVAQNGDHYFWGQNQHGIALDRTISVIERPKKIETFSSYNFQQMVTSHNHTLAVGRSIVLEFVLTDMQDEVFSMHSVHVYDENNLRSLKDIRDVLNSLQDEFVGFLNDFDIPYVNVATKYPKLKKKKKPRRLNTDGEEEESDEDGDDGEEEEEDDDKDDDDEDEDEDEDGSQKSGDDDDDADGDSHKKRQVQSLQEDDDEEDDGESTKKKSKKSKKQRRKRSKKKRKDGSDREDDDNQNPVKKIMTPQELKELAVKEFMINLNQKKTHFKDIQSKIMPPICEQEEEYEPTLEDQVFDNKSQLTVGLRPGDTKATPDQRRQSVRVQPQQQKSRESDQDSDNEENNRKGGRRSSKRQASKRKKATDESEEENSDESDDDSRKNKKKKTKKSKRKTKSDDDSDLKSDDKRGSSDEDDEDSDQSDDDDEESDEDGSDEDDSDQSESESESEEEDDYTKNEKAYQISSEPEELRPKQLHRHKCKNLFLNHKVIFVNFIAEDCQYVLKKLISIVDLLHNNLRVLIINMPQEATMIETYYAKLLCQLCFMLGGELQVFFIKYEDKTDFINKVFQRDRKKLTQLTSIKFRSKISEGTLLYTWGCANYGKLGLSHKIKHLTGNKQFYQEMKYVWTQKDTDLSEMEILQQHGKSNLFGLFTPTPQPVISMLGIKIRQLAVGEDHCMALSADGSVYVWGDNRKHQLGIEQSHLHLISKPSLEDDDENEDLLNQNASLNGQVSSKDINTKMMSGVSQQVKMEYVGVPTLVDKINGRVNFIACGSYNSFASVNLV
eukprot:403356926